LTLHTVNIAIIILQCEIDKDIRANDNYKIGNAQTTY